MYEYTLYGSDHPLEMITIKNTHKFSNLFVDGSDGQVTCDLAQINPQQKRTFFFKTPFWGKLYASHNKFEIIEITQFRSLNELLSKSKRGVFCDDPLIFDRMEGKWFTISKVTQERKFLDLKSVWKKVKFHIKKLYSK